VIFILYRGQRQKPLNNACDATHGIIMIKLKRVIKSAIQRHRDQLMVSIDHFYSTKNLDGAPLTVTCRLNKMVRLRIRVDS
jgi:hypothetical protein